VTLPFPTAKHRTKLTTTGTPVWQRGARFWHHSLRWRGASAMSQEMIQRARGWAWVIGAFIFLMVVAFKVVPR
jgi:hypothetical protein